MSTGKNIPLRLKETFSVKRIGKELLVRSLVALADRTFPGEFLFLIRFPTTVVTRKGETTMSLVTLRVRPTRYLGLPLLPKTKRLSSPGSPGKGESVSYPSLFPRPFQSARKRNQKSGLIKI